MNYPNDIWAARNQLWADECVSDATHYIRGALVMALLWDRFVAGVCVGMVIGGSFVLWTQ